MYRLFDIQFTISLWKKQGRIHGNPVADGWAGAVMRKPLAIQKCYGPTDQRTDTVRCSRVSATKNVTRTLTIYIVAHVT